MIQNAFQLLSATAILFFSSCGERNEMEVSGKGIFSRADTSLPGTEEKLTTLSQVRCIYEDKKGNFWFGTNSSGLYFYDGKLLRSFSRTEGLPANQVQSIQGDASGKIWLGLSGYQVCSFDGKNFKTRTNEKVNQAQPTDEKKWDSEAEDLWFCAGAGVFRCRKDSLVYLPFPVQTKSKKFQAANEGTEYGVYTILKDRKGNVWFGTQAMGVGCFNGRSFKWYTEKELGGPAVVCSFEDSKGNIWFGNNGGGLFMFDGDSMRNITAERGLGNPEFRKRGKVGPGTMARVWAINEDNSGNIWVGTVDAGVWKFDGRSFSNYTVKDGLPASEINVIYKDKNGELWFGSESADLCKLNADFPASGGGMFNKVFFKEL